MHSDYAPLFKLDRAERIQLVEALWDSIADEDAPATLPDWQRDELRQREARFSDNPASGLTWEEVKARART